jgi:hypothetical protein
VAFRTTPEDELSTRETQTLAARPSLHHAHLDIHDGPLALAPASGLLGEAGDEKDPAVGRPSQESAQTASDGFEDRMIMRHPSPDCNHQIAGKFKTSHFVPGRVELPQDRWGRPETSEVSDTLHPVAHVFRSFHCWTPRSAGCYNDDSGGRCGRGKHGR